MSKHHTNGKSALKIVHQKHATEATTRGHGPSVGEELTDFSVSAKTEPELPPDTPDPEQKARNEAFDEKAPGLRQKLADVAEEEIAKANAPGNSDGAVRCALGIENIDGVPTICWQMGSTQLRLSPVQAADLARDLEMMAREVQLPSRIAAAKAEKDK